MGDAADCWEASPHGPRDWQRFYLGYRERFVEDCCIQLPNGREVRLKQAPSAKQFKQRGHQQQQQQRPRQQQQQQQGLDKQSDPALTGSTVWDGAVVLAQYLCGSGSPLHGLKVQRINSSCPADSNDGGCVQSGADGQCSSCSEPHQAQGGVGQLPLAQPPTHAIAESMDEPQQQQQGQQQGQPQQGQPQHGQQQQEGQQQQHAEPELPMAHALTCLELGAGTGAVSLCLLAAGMVESALLTDIPDMLPHLQSNVEHNSGVLDPQGALVLPLRWGEAGDVCALQRLGQLQQLEQRRRRVPQVSRQKGVSQLPPQLQPPFDLIVGSDLIYYSYTPSTPHSRLLLQALVQLAGPHSLIFLALSLHHNPQEVHAFLEWAQQEWGFQVRTVTQGIPEEFVVPDVLVVQLRMLDPEKAAAAAAAAAAGTLRRKDEGVVA